MKKDSTSDGATGAYTLGLDLGVGSSGWAALFGDKLSDQTLRMGVRVFEPKPRTISKKARTNRATKSGERNAKLVKESSERGVAASNFSTF